MGMQGLRNIMDTILPSVCLVCGAKGGTGRDLCANCLELLVDNHPACPVCALPASHGHAGLCGRCLHHHPPYQSGLSFWRYQAPLDGLLLGLKYHRQLPVARLLGRMMAERLSEASVSYPQALIPVPLHASRLRSRGFNQAIELFMPLARSIGVPLLREAVLRLEPTPSQVGLSALQRRRNLRGVFQVRHSLPDHVAIVDDVVTTGSTVAELARVLRRAGVGRIDVWSVARADEPQRTR
jgi:ComF family protein